MKNICATILLLLAPVAAAGPIHWTKDVSRVELEPFWAPGAYIARDKMVRFMPNLPTKTTRWAAGCVKGEQSFLELGAKFEIGKDFRLMGWREGLLSAAILFVEGRAQGKGEGWLMFIATVPNLHPLQAANAWPDLARLWGEEAWTFSPPRKWSATVDGVDGAKFSGKAIEATLQMGEKGLGLEVANLSHGVIRILWDQCSFVGPDGYADAVIHTGVRLLARGETQTPTVIPPGARVQEAVFPKSKISWESGPGGGWSYEPLFPGLDSGSFTLVLAIESDGSVIYEAIKAAFVATKQVVEF